MSASRVAFAGALACNPEGPRLDPGEGFMPFGEREQAVARGGSAGPGWEWALGSQTDADYTAHGDLDWVSGRTYAWTLTYSAGGSAALEIRDGGALALRLDYPSGMRAGNALELEVGTNPSMGPDTTVSAAITRLNGEPASAAAFQTGNRLHSAQAAFLYYPPMAQGFTAEGTVTLAYLERPVGQRALFRVRAGTLPCTNQAPSVSIATPAPSQLYHAPAAIELQADAADADGTVASVQFLANGVPIGTATSSPFAIQWPNVASGAYSLTAIATDNAGDRTTSAAVPILVNAPPSVSLASPAAGATFTAPASITLTGQASDSDGSIASVEFLYGETSITTLSSPPYSFVWTDVPPGTYSLTARATDDRGAAVASAPVNVTVNSAAAKLHFIHVDHLNSPRLVADDLQRTVWTWDQLEPFGSNAADANPSGLGDLDLPLRLPGQYLDKETGLHYNYFRDYDASIGRYKQSDPIGLLAGTNLYSYVNSNPLGLSDPEGLRGTKGQVTHCGTGWKKRFTPEGFRDVSFTQACKNHDDCYDTCGASKLDCDYRFYKDASGACRQQAGSELRECLERAQLFYAAVLYYGDGPFRDAQAKACHRCHPLK